MKKELDGKTMAEFAILRLKTYSCLVDDSDKIKKNRNHKKSKQNIEFKDYINFLEAN